MRTQRRLLQGLSGVAVLLLAATFMSIVFLSRSLTEGVALGAVTAVVLVLLGGGYLLVRRDLRLRRVIEASLRAANEAADLANRELESFSYSVAHDLRAPLRSIDGFSLALLEDHGESLGEGGRDALARVRAAAAKMGRLIHDLLQLSRITRAPLAREAVDLSAIAGEIASDLSATDPTRSVEFAIQPGVVVEGDAGLLRVVLSNLLGNAWKYSSKKARSKIEFGSKPEGAASACYVRDDGAGFDMAYAGKLFGVFQRLHTESEFPGTGVGLATVQRVVRRHGGRVRAEGKAGEGATFWFVL